ncbi:hypothetical protein [Leuconostoc pseudomesenteroides]|uniref:hypothetical protein n=1 Tax=Leuconostoc pseudomesenteroides TaxID=33968 RepID=UPI002898B858|nr:hypothetical protein [Leuconostoc pseudomesenteroides]
MKNKNINYHLKINPVRAIYNKINYFIHEKISILAYSIMLILLTLALSAILPYFFSFSHGNEYRYGLALFIYAYTFVFLDASLILKQCLHKGTQSYTLFLDVANVMVTVFVLVLYYITFYTQIIISSPFQFSWRSSPNSFILLANVMLFFMCVYTIINLILFMYKYYGKKSGLFASLVLIIIYLIFQNCISTSQNYDRLITIDTQILPKINEGGDKRGYSPLSETNGSAYINYGLYYNKNSQYGITQKFIYRILIRSYNTGDSVGEILTRSKATLNYTLSAPVGVTKKKKSAITELKDWPKLKVINLSKEVTYPEWMSQSSIQETNYRFTIRQTIYSLMLWIINALTLTVAVSQTFDFLKALNKFSDKDKTYTIKRLSSKKKSYTNLS